MTTTIIDASQRKAARVAGVTGLFPEKLTLYERKPMSAEPKARAQAEQIVLWVVGLKTFRAN